MAEIISFPTPEFIEISLYDFDTFDDFLDALRCGWMRMNPGEPLPEALRGQDHQPPCGGPIEVVMEQGGVWKEDPDTYGDDAADE